MKNHYKSLSKILLIAILLVSTNAAFSQLKIGSNPTQINKSSILELESDRQGFLLPRLADTTGINALTPPDGMLIYLASADATGRGLYIRKAGIWQRFMTDSSSMDKWSKQGDVLVGTEKFGSLNAQTLRMITNGIERMTIDGNTGDVQITNNTTIAGNASVNKSIIIGDTASTRRLIVADSVSFKRLLSSDNLTEILVIDTANGSVQRRTIALDAFKNWITGPFSHTANPHGISRRTGTNGTDTLVLHAADATNAGGVSTTTQTFGGNKTFQDSLTAAQTLRVGATGSANSTLEVQGSVAMSIKTITSTYTLTDKDYTVLVDAKNAAVTVTLPAPSPVITGRTYVVKKIAGGLTNDVIVQGAIEDGTSVNIYNDWTVLKVQTDGNRWYVIK